MKIISETRAFPIPAITFFENGFESECVLEKGKSVSIAFAEGRYCTSCFKEIISGSSCSECAFANAFNICLKCTGGKCLQYEEGLKANCFGQKYCVYLALFGESVKAGVSRESRFRERLLEQGADFALKVFGGLDGQKARLAESMLFARGLLEKVTSSQKIEWLSLEPREEKLVDAREKAVRALNGFSGNFVEGRPVDLRAHYEIPSGKISETGVLAGAVEGWKGPLVFLKRQGFAAFVLSKALGRAVEEKKKITDF